MANSTKKTYKSRGGTTRATAHRPVKARTRAKAPAKAPTRAKAPAKTRARAKALGTKDLIKRGPRKSRGHSRHAGASSQEQQENSAPIAQVLKLTAASSKHQEERPDASSDRDGSPEGASPQEHGSSPIAPELSSTAAEHQEDRSGASSYEDGSPEGASSQEHQDGSSLPAEDLSSSAASEHEGDRSAASPEEDSSIEDLQEHLEDSSLNSEREKPSDGQDSSPFSALLQFQMSTAGLIVLSTWAMVTWQQDVILDLCKVFGGTLYAPPR